MKACVTTRLTSHTSCTSIFYPNTHWITNTQCIAVPVRQCSGNVCGTCVCVVPVIHFYQSSSIPWCHILVWIVIVLVIVSLWHYDTQCHGSIIIIHRLTHTFLDPVSCVINSLYSSLMQYVFYLPALLSLPPVSLFTVLLTHIYHNLTWPDLTWYSCQSLLIFFLSHTHILASSFPAAFFPLDMIQGVLIGMWVIVPPPVPNDGN